jgi:hypothetical protein
VSNPLATPGQKRVEALALKLASDPHIRAMREAARAILLADPVAQTRDGAQGLDRALDLWVMALIVRVINADRARPEVIWNVYNPARRWFGHIYPGAAVAIDNPDNVNREIPIDGESRYVISGQMGANRGQFMIELVADFVGYAGLGRTLMALTSQQLVVDDAGRFTISVDSGEGGDRANHLRSEPGKLWIFARDSMWDWMQDPVALSVERVSGPLAPPARSEVEIVSEVVGEMPRWVTFWCGFKNDFQGNPEPNKLIGPVGRPGGWGCLYGGKFALDAEDCIVVTTVDGGAAYTGFQIADAWTLSPEPALRLVSQNKSQARANLDGTYTYVVSQIDPGVWNWIDANGLERGWMLLRWQGIPAAADTTSFVRSVELVRRDALNLPDVPRATLADRAAQIQKRVAGHDRRVRNGDST